MKYTLKNIKEKKLRTFLVLLSITLSTGLFFASMAISDTVEEMYVDQMRRYFGNAEISIYPDKDSPSSFFRIDKAEKYEDDMEYVIGLVRGTGAYKHVRNEEITVNLYGYNLEELQQINPISLYKEYEIEDFSGKKIIIGLDTADKYKLELGDSFDIEINNRKHRFIITGIAIPQGLFTPGEGNITVVVPKDTLAQIYEARGRVNTVYMKSKEEADVGEAIACLSMDYPRYVVKETISQDAADSFTKNITTTFMLMLVLVIFISIFIIYTSFKVITMERLPMIGTFRSIGATKKMTDILLLGESLVYGLVGGALGCVVGIGILRVMTSVMATATYSDVPLKAEMVFSTWQLIGAFLGAIILSFISSLIPIVRVSKIPVRDIVLNNMQGKSKKSNRKYIVGFILLVLSLLLPAIAPRSIALSIDMLGLLGVGVSIILLVPIVTRIFTYLFEGIYNIIFGNMGILAVKNLRTNKSAMNNIALLTIGIASLLMINTISYSVMTELVNVYSQTKYDIMFTHPRGDRVIERRVKTVDGVASTLLVYGAQNVKVTEANDEIWALFGIDENRYFDYNDFKIVGDKEKLLGQLGQGRNMILSTVLKEKWKLEEGDLVTLDTPRGPKIYKIVGFVNTIMMTGRVAYVSDEYLKRDMNVQYASDIYIRTSKDPIEVNEKLKVKFRDENIWTITMSELQKIEERNNSQIFLLLKGFSVVTMIIGIFGIFNNYIVSFISRKRGLAIIRSVGMSKVQTLKMLFIEALTGGLIGGIVGCIGGWLFIVLAKFLMMDVNLAIPIHYSPRMFMTAIISGIAISLISSISPALKSSKLNIIEAIKYE